MTSAERSTGSGEVADEAGHAGVVVFFERAFGLIDLRVLGGIGSDHFPAYAALCHAPAGSDRHEPPPPEPRDVEAAREAIREGREVARERR